MGRSGKIEVLIVDDSLFFCTALEQDLSRDLGLKVVGTAQSAEEAFTKIKQLEPDVVTLDVEMPDMNGIDFLKKLMPVHPMPVVVVSAMPIEALDALEAGAVDFVKKPTIKKPSDRQDFAADLALKIKIASAAKLKLHKLEKPVSTPARKLLGVPDTNTVIAIGASTGGTEATLEVIKDLPPETPGIVITQHMPAGFTKMYAERLDRICKMKVKEAKNLDRVRQGQIIVAAGENQMRLCRDSAGYYITSAPGEKVSGHCPSVDVLFESAAKAAGANAIGIILTGMGADGAEGLLKMRKAGAYTIGQDKESCVVYGMPMQAFKIGAVQKQLPLSAIGNEIIDRINLMKK